MSQEPVLSDPDAFNATVWEIVRQIPAGRVFAYGQIAELIPCPPQMTEKEYLAYRSRWVGTAMSKSPADVAWQRVINAQGKISLKSGKLANEQRRLLEAEGVKIDEHGRIDFKLFGWAGPDREWIRENGLVEPEEDKTQGQLPLF